MYLPTAKHVLTRNGKNKKIIVFHSKQKTQQNIMY